jgi:hypothetical protein
MTHNASTGARSLASTDCTNSTVIDAEEQLERQIEAARQRMCAAPDRTLKMQYWREMCGLIDQRTPSRRRFMERVQGLA